MPTTISVRTVSALAAGSVPLVGTNPRRRALVVSCPPTNRFTINIGAVAVLDQGITLYPTDPPYEFTREVYGDAIEESLTVISGVADQNVTYVEISDAP